MVFRSLYPVREAMDGGAQLRHRRRARAEQEAMHAQIRLRAAPGERGHELARGVEFTIADDE